MRNSLPQFDPHTYLESLPVTANIAAILVNVETDWIRRQVEGGFITGFGSGRSTLVLMSDVVNRINQISEFDDVNQTENIKEVF